ATHASTTDPDARLAKRGKGGEARLAFAADALMENRHGLLVDFTVTTATGTADAALRVDAERDPEEPRLARPRVVHLERGRGRPALLGVPSIVPVCRSMLKWSSQASTRRLNSQTGRPFAGSSPPSRARFRVVTRPAGEGEVAVEVQPAPDPRDDV